jgi:hypothetical protein
MSNSVSFGALSARRIGIAGLAAVAAAGFLSGPARADHHEAPCGAADGTIRIVALMKRIPTITHEEFVEHYEKVHRLIGEKYLKDYAVKYSRRYLEGFPDPLTGNEQPPVADAITEIVYRDKAAFDAANAQFSRPEVSAEVMGDVKTFLDLANSPHYFVTECVSDLK